MASAGTITLDSFSGRTVCLRFYTGAKRAILWEIPAAEIVKR